MYLRKVGNKRVWLSINNRGKNTLFELRLKKNEEPFAQMTCSIYKKEIRLHWIKVDGTFLQMGYGSFLINQLFKYNKRITASTHVGALGFFHKMGFKSLNNGIEDMYDIEWNPQ